MRVCELVDIKRQHVDIKTMSIRLEAADTKTRVGRVVPISPRAAKLLSEYMAETKITNKRVRSHTLRHTSTLFNIMNGMIRLVCSGF
ncbi:hypothetical protein [Mesobacillus foraminis]|uniref:hypothetical protein n=1 Tax=Mesobacillus foraminis TaxID=279826 RepID=UPI00214BF157|nr:hypothetical protein [Mesobacillus foraminis]